MGYAVLIIEDEAVLARKVSKFLQQQGYEVRLAANGAEGLEALASFHPDAVLLDFNLPGNLNGLDVLAKIQALEPGIKVILVTGFGNVRLAVDAMKAGAYDYLSKPIVLGELKLLLDRAINQRQTEEQLSYFRERLASEGGLELMIGESEPIRELKSRIMKFTQAIDGLAEGRTPPSVLITGETGTGKELVARALHFSGPRRAGPFVELNAANLPAHLVESELFGYERGAFTDARERKLGLVEAANGGTLFLDEIGELDIAIQAKLLKLLEDRKVRRLGSVRDVTVDLQIITATNRSLPDLVAAGRFREDLLFRLNTLTLQVPPLRERNGDILLLADHILKQFMTKYAKPGLQLSADVSRRLLQYHWPGNVRELRNRMEQAVLLGEGSELDVAHFNLPQTTEPPVTATEQEVHPSIPGPLEADDDIPSIAKLQEMEREMIEQTLSDVDGNVSKAARRLGISRDRLRYRLEKYQLERK